MFPSRLLLVLGILAVATACNDNKPPVAPESPRQPTVAIAVTGPDAVLTGRSVIYTATVTLSDGTNPTGPTEWTSSNPAVATVNSAGHVETRTHGTTTLTATYLGRTDSKTLKVINDYGGAWQGRYVVTACTDEHGGCPAGAGRAGTIFPLDVTLVHQRDDVSQVTGTMPLLDGELRGAVGADGRLTLTGSLTWWGYDREELTTTQQFSPWDTNLDGGGMTGRFSLRYTSHLSPVFTVRTENEFVTMTRARTSAVSPSERR